MKQPRQLSALSGGYRRLPSLTPTTTRPWLNGRTRSTARVYLHAADRQWVMRPDASIIFWDGETRTLDSGLTLIRAGGHFAGGTMLHWESGAEGRGALLSGDIFQVVPDRRFVSFMYSYPNLIPLSAKTVRRMLAVVAPYRYDRIYGAWWDRVVDQDGMNAVARSAARFIAALDDTSTAP